MVAVQYSEIAFVDRSCRLKRLADERALALSLGGQALFVEEFRAPCHVSVLAWSPDLVASMMHAHPVTCNDQQESAAFSSE